MAKTNRVVRNLDDAFKAYGGKRKFAEAGQGACFARGVSILGASRRRAFALAGAPRGWPLIPAGVCIFGEAGAECLKAALRARGNDRTPKGRDGKRLGGANGAGERGPTNGGEPPKPPKTSSSKCCIRRAGWMGIA
jgi:hypothetical protein